jgi:hypothetical protein
MSTLHQQIMEHARQLPEGSLLRAKELLHLGGRAGIDQALCRLVRSGQLLRAGRGLYLRPIETRFGTRSPDPHTVIAAIAKAKGETVATTGATAANALGLTTQVPLRIVYLTSGRTRRILVGSQTVDLRHAPRWQLELASSRAGLAIRALAWSGPERAAEVTQTLRGQLSAAELRSLAQVQGRLPDWVAAQVSVLTRA